LTIGSLKHLTTKERLRLKMGEDARHRRVAKEFQEIWNNDGNNDVDIMVSRVLNDGIMCKDKKTNKYYMVIKTNGTVGGYPLTYVEVNKHFNEYKRSKRPWAERFKNHKLYRSPFFNERMVAI
jgi:hypothetical protein